MNNVKLKKNEKEKKGSIFLPSLLFFILIINTLLKLLNYTSKNSHVLSILKKPITRSDKNFIQATNFLIYQMEVPF